MLDDPRIHPPLLRFLFGIAFRLLRALAIAPGAFGHVPSKMRPSHP